MWSFIGIFLLVVVALLLLTQPAVGRFFYELTMLAFFLLIALGASLVIWLALRGNA